MRTQLAVISAEPAARKSERGGPLDYLALALSEDDFALAAGITASALARNFSCDHAAIGMLKGHSSALVAWSEMADIRKEMGAVRQIVAAMDEAVDQHGSLRFPPSAEDPPRITLMHAELSGAGLGAAVLTVPLSAHQRVIGAISLLRNRSWSDDELAQLETLANTLGPVLELKQRASQSVAAHLQRRFNDYVDTLRGPGAIGTKLLSSGIVMLLAASLFVPVTDSVSAKARLEGIIQRSIAAPSDSFIHDVYARPGARVKAGELLLTLQDTELRNEQGRLESELARFRGEQADAFARQDRAQMVIAQSRAEEIAAQLALVSDQLARTRLVAPFDGIIIRGDLQQQAGAPVKRGDILMVLAPSDNYRLVLQVDERDVARLTPGQTGKAAFPALPGGEQTIRIERITPVASLADGRNTFEVEASLLGSLEGLRPGLEGVAHIGQAQRPLALIWGQRILDWCSFKLWTLFG